MSHETTELIVEADAAAEMYDAAGVRLTGCVSTNLLASLLAPLFERIADLEDAVYELEES